MYVLLADILVWQNKYDQAAFVASLALERFSDNVANGDVASLKRIINLVSNHYRIHLQHLRDYVSEHVPSDSEIPGKDLFEFLEKLPEVDDSLYLMLPEDFAKQNPNCVVKGDGESKILI